MLSTLAILTMRYVQTITNGVCKRHRFSFGFSPFVSASSWIGRKSERNVEKMVPTQMRQHHSSDFTIVRFL